MAAWCRAVAVGAGRKLAMKLARRETHTPQGGGVSFRWRVFQNLPRPSACLSAGENMPWCILFKFRPALYGFARSCCRGELYRDEKPPPGMLRSGLGHVLL